ncbi:MAG: peptidylprolyl isomerase [Deltaproteobacteria bacterium]
MKRRAICLRYCNILIVIGCLTLSAAAGHAELVDRIVAIVNDECIALSELNEALDPFVQQIREAGHPPEVEREMIFRIREDLLDKMIDQKLTSQESERLNIAVDDREVDQQIERIKSEHFLTDEELRQSLAGEGYALEEYRKRIREQLLQMKLINIEVKSKVAITEKDIEDYYEEHKKEFQVGQKYHLRTILIKVTSSASADQSRAALEKVESIEQALKAGVNFEELARQYSEDSTAATGGDLGLFTLDELSPEFRDTVRSLGEGQVSAALRTPNGYQFLKLEDIKGAPGRTLKEARIEIHERLYREFVEEKYRAWLKALRDRSYVKIIL